ncbi:unnamed protein product [Notodromas monacha]|uniref:TATA-binding protein-associated factor 172 n=1 Tax=Notodromas monacha TaxID=399045 RepID=A0A7R9BWV3_9CRUS|nr:unnamed protein product [Notodromas monacha]CAG0923265.1 unnamed protein product [Notodromas monacha]
MATRLDRLFVLLESGSSSATRQAAAKQLGEVVRLHPQELPVLLSRLLKCIRNSSWDTRVAAGQAVNAIASAVPQAINHALKNGDLKPKLEDVHGLNVKTFDPAAILSSKVVLIASQGSEYNFDASDLSGEKQQSIIRKKLGLDFAEKIGLDTSDIVSNQDLSTALKSEVQITIQPADGSSAVLASFGIVVPSKRKLDDDSPKNSKKMLKVEEECEEVICDPSSWPFMDFAKILCRNLFSARWETRHGAATALREILKVHDHQVLEKHWYEDVALKLICVLMLDRFGDFVSDQVVAPVREAAAQALGYVIHSIDEDLVLKLLDITVQLTSNPEWQVKHGALLGVKYIVAVREHLMKLVPQVYDNVFQCLRDPIDDVAAAAAAALVPATNVIIEALPHRVEELLSTLWDSLLHLDELTSATSNVMILLSKVLGCGKADATKLKDLVPRLWPFLGHNSANVRKSTLIALKMLLLNQTVEGQGAEWLHSILPVLLGQIFYRALTETSVDLHEFIIEVWEAAVLRTEPSHLVAVASAAITGWLAMLMSQPHMHLDLNLLGVGCKIAGRESPICLGGQDSTLNEAEKEDLCIRARLLGIRMLGFLSGPMTVVLPGIDYGGSSPVEMYAQLLKNPLEARSAYGRMVIAVLLSEWAERWPDSDIPAVLASTLSEGLNQVLYYDEIAHAFTRLQQDARDFMASVHHSFPQVPPFSASNVLTLKQVSEMAETWAPQVFLTKKIPPNRMTVLEDMRKAILNSVEKTSRDHSKLALVCNACMAEALVAMKKLPEKLSPTVRSLMDAIKMQKNPLLRLRAAKAIANLLKLAMNRVPPPNPKIVKNLITYATADCLITPKVGQPCESIPNSSKNNPVEDSIICTKTSGILKLYRDRMSSEKSSVKSQDSAQALQQDTFQNGCAQDPVLQREAEVLLRIGGEAALIAIVASIGPELKTQLPSLWEAAFVIPICEECEKDEQAQHAVNSLRTAEIILPEIHASLLHLLGDFVRRVMEYLEHSFTVIRHMASRVMAALATANPVLFVGPNLPLLLRSLDKMDSDASRQGAIETISLFLEKTGLRILPYVPVFLVPVLRRMSDQNVPVRLLAAKCFANLVKLMPLASGESGNDLQLDPALEKARKEQLNFITQLLNPSLVGDSVLPESVDAKLRRYQQDGLNWLMFLNRYQLHGILCDDMGLGKTLQTICLMISSNNELRKKKNTLLPSIVICPPTLVGHWFYEVEKFVKNQALNPLMYAGPPGERMRLRLKVPEHNLIIASYDIVRNDVEFFSSIKWNYCILDEGHVIKNGKTKMAKAIKQLTASHRLILSGTPIQNNVLELWSLFDFLMPGFLGSERDFSWRYSRPILQSRDGKATAVEQQAGALALEALHRQMLPFLLRRMKTDVLEDLPPKITQDYYCELSPLQQKLYESFAKSQTCKDLGDVLSTEEEETKKPNVIHVFQALQYLKKVCNHPKLVLNDQHPEKEAVAEYLSQKNSRIDDINHAAKLPALKQLLNDCGIGCETEAVVSEHRALIFCQLKSMMDIIECDLFKKYMPEVTYLRLDGSVPPAQRHNLVTRFNNDASIDVLLLTTQVGGLGLNLTGADTVIFVEHDWNPMKDVQAMDRAHRIGQKKVVNVYRLITRGTLEEKIMGLQKFKLNTANSVVNQENSALATMSTDQLLEAFSFSDSREAEKQSGTKIEMKKSGVKSVLEGLPDLWEESQYDEYNLDSFISTLKSGSS